MKNKVQTMAFWIVLIYLCCYFLKIFDFPNELTVILGGLLCGVMVLQEKYIRIDVGICLLTVAMFSYYLIVNGKEGLFYSILYIPLIIYILTNYLVNSVQIYDNKNKLLFVLLFVLVAGFAIHGILNSYMWYAGYVVPGTRRWQDFWSREIVPGTQHIAYFLPAFSCFVPAVLYAKKRKWLSILIVILTMFFSYTSLATKSRMSILIFAIVICLQMLLFVILEREIVKKMMRSRWLWIAGIVLLASVLLSGFILKDSTVVVAFLENMSKGGGILNNVRFVAQRMALKQLFLYPMGGYLMDFGEISHAHNTWLDIANAAGLIPFFSFVAYTGYTVYEQICLLLKKNVPTETKLIITGTYVAFFLYFSVEPVMEASVHLMTPWIFLNGLVHGCIVKREG